MNHEHISFEDVRRFARLAMGLVSADDPRWVTGYTASVRICDSCREIACRANRLLLPDEYGDRIDPNDWRDDCLSIDDMMDLMDGSPEAEHLQHCAACQLRYCEALALSEIGAMEAEDASVAQREPGVLPTVIRMEPTDKVIPSLLEVGVRIAASWAGIVLGPELLSGLLGTDETKLVAEAVVRKRHVLENVRIEIDDEAKTLMVKGLPPSCAGDRIRLRVGAEIITPSSSEATEARFDISRMWQVGDHTFDLILADPSM